jgi:glycosyltransferase involved in cell wall biosynthesis
MTRPYLSVVIPAFNEAKRLPLTLIDIDRHLSQKEFSYDITVVVSPSSDNTLEILKRFETIIKNLKVIPLIENQGRGLAVRTGMLSAKGNWRLIMDADNSTTIMEFEKMQPYLDSYDAVIGSRYISGGQIQSPAPIVRRFMDKIGQRLIRMFLTPGIRDTDCGFKCFSATITDKLFAKAKSDGWTLDAEILSSALRAGYKIKEVPIFWSYQLETSGENRSYLKNFIEYCRVWRNRKQTDISVKS